MPIHDTVSGDTGSRRKTPGVRAAACALLVAACGGGGDGSSPPAAPAPEPIPNTVNPTVSPSSVTAVVGKPATAVEIAFEATTSTAADLTVDTSALPAGWTVTSGGTCPQVPSGTGCTLVLSYAPTAPSSGAPTVSLPYRYVDSLGAQRTGTASVPYTARMAFAYLVKPSSPTASGSVFRCNVDDMGGLGGCADSGASGLGTPYRIAFNEDTAYIANASAGGRVRGFVTRCALAADGSLGSCTNQTIASLVAPVDISIQGTQAYIADWQSGNVARCQIVPDGTLVGCVSQSTGVSQLSGMAFDGTSMYLTSEVGPALTRCDVNEDGSLAACASAGVASPATTTDVMVVGTQLFMPAPAAPGLSRCSLASDGTVSLCTVVPLATPRPTTLDAFNGYAYVVDNSTGGTSAVLRCPLDASGALGACTAATTPGVDALSIRFN